MMRGMGEHAGEWVVVIYRGGAGEVYRYVCHRDELGEVLDIPPSDFGDDVTRRWDEYDGPHTDDTNYFRRVPPEVERAETAGAAS